MVNLDDEIKILYQEYSTQYDMLISLWKDTKRLTNRAGFLVFLLALTITVTPGSISISGISGMLDSSGLIVLRLLIVIALIGIYIETSSRITFLSHRYWYILKIENILSATIPHLDRERTYRQMWSPFYSKFLGMHSWRPLFLDLIVIGGLISCGIISITQKDILSAAIQVIGMLIVIIVLIKAILIENRLNTLRLKSESNAV